ncbi:MAG: UDP-N-acetylmuramoyl-L-alanyl-D-glutamate--2,6-diaminopimelate ligase [Alphaproteobacteria bacterium]|nr:UDP-N-acetylmuramoyl-L-alanyl-D-glutamate--2,6-diaminopimelate ligase [Alphaproteobacteria bacterium]
MGGQQVQLSDLYATGLTTENDPEILGLSADSRTVTPGTLFAALKGVAADGADFIPQAIANGAVAILADPGTASASIPVPVIEDQNPRRALAQIAAKFFGSQPETAVAVTGTNGKTSVAGFARQIWKRQGLTAATLGTLGVLGPNETEILRHTTPEPIELHRVLADLAQSGVTHVALEASSHGLSQSRLAGTKLKAGAFTNLSRDHLDYHPTVEAYLAAKMRLFTEIMDADATAVLNADSHEYPEIAAACRARGQQVIGYGRHAADLRVTGLRPNGSSQYLEMRMNGQDHSLRLPLLGDFQVWTALCAVGLVIATGGDADAALDSLEHLHGVPGRLQWVAEHNGGRVFVDYAHTPDALDHCLRALRPHATHHLTVVFGCGGERDTGKREQMGQIACGLADRVIVTDDNPRNEDPAIIRKQVMTGCDHAVEVPGRGEAIRAAIAGLDEGDILVLAGKGVESGQDIGSEVVPFDDATQAQAAAQEFRGAA